MTMLAHEVRFDLLAHLRNPRARVMTLAFPLILLVILVGLAGKGTTTVGGDPVGLRRFFVGGIMAMSLLSACYGSLLVTIVSQRETGVFKRRRSTPVPAWVVVAGQAVTSLVVAAITSLALVVAARVLYGVGIPAQGLAACALAVVCGAVAFSSVAYAASTLIPNVDAAQPAVQLTMLPLWFISGIWFSTDDLPEWLRRVSEALPVEPLSHALHLAVQSGSVDGGDVLTLAVWAAGGILIAARRFSWLPSPAAA